MVKRFRDIAAVSVAIAVLMVFSGQVEAQERAGAEIEAIDLTVLGTIGGGYPDRAGLFLAVRLRRIPETPLALEVGLYVPWGIGANLLIDVFRNDNWRVHLLDPGVFYAWCPGFRIIRPDVERAVDITFGTGLEWQFADRWWLTVDFRFFFPEPRRVISHYGDFARRIYTQSAEGVQTWVGVGYSF
ncbi:hypothetical protein KKF05_02925 [Patescibacteria group bacterium]|nr:hypothetical protein [Patescibacteria group bacterium]MBU1029067.1 hypothetical protein [Patescibacteria group bacterium]MBU1915613.1 hypothetical protein [Patescibacteria group bacterium]